MTELAPGQIVGGLRHRYTVERALGSGGFGHTFVARTEDGVEVVLKQLRVDRMKDWKALELFEREARVLASLAHPLIPRHVELFAHDGAQPFAPAALSDPQGTATMLVSVHVYVPGQSLEEHVVAGSPLAPAHLSCILEQLLGVLGYLHGLQPPVVHRDIKPANVVIDPQGAPYLLDFGAIKDHLRSGGSTTVGTYGYFPMEQMMGQSRAASDLYSLGMTMLVVATRVRPEDMPTDANTGKVDLARLAPGLPAGVAAALDAMLEPVVGRRVQSTDQVLALLRNPTQALVARPTQALVPERSPGVALLSNLSIGAGGVGAAVIYFVFFNSLSETLLVQVSALWVAPLVFGICLKVAAGTLTKNPITVSIAATGIALLLLIGFFVGIFPAL
jgi:serine/threonine protein kinase